MNIEMIKVSHAYDGSAVLKDFSLQFSSREVTVLLGPSGCGKTTILHILSGLIVPREGEVRVGGKPCSEARVGYMFQDVRLVPWLTVGKNLDLVLSPSMPKADREAKIREVLELVELGQTFSMYPDQLSGGMFRRVGLARAFLFEPDIYLMDESFQGLDPPLKLQLLSAFMRVRKVNPKTTVFVTHDIEEALLVGDTVHLLSALPARIERSLKNPVPPAERWPGHPELSKLEGELFSYFSPHRNLFR